MIMEMLFLFSLISVCAFITYTVHEIGNAVVDWYNDL